MNISARLKPGISTPQTDDIKSHGIQLVIPYSFHKTVPAAEFALDGF